MLQTHDLEVPVLKGLIALALPLVLATQAHASAFDSLDDQKLQEQALSLLEQNKDSIRMTGDVHASEKLSDILGQIDKYNEEIMKRLEEGRDLEDMESNVSTVDTKCAIQKDEKTAQCDLLITFKPLGETNINFTVVLDSEKNAVSIVELVTVARGD